MHLQSYFNEEDKINDVINEKISDLPGNLTQDQLIYMSAY